MSNIRFKFLESKHYIRMSWVVPQCYCTMGQLNSFVGTQLIDINDWKNAKYVCQKPHLKHEDALSFSFTKFFAQIVFVPATNRRNYEFAYLAQWIWRSIVGHFIEFLSENKIRNKFYTFFVTLRMNPLTHLHGTLFLRPSLYPIFDACNVPHEDDEKFIVLYHDWIFQISARLTNQIAEINEF